MSDTIQVRYFGLHRSEENIEYLHQGNGRGMNFIGLSGPSPFEVTFDTKKKPMCPHKIDLTPGSPDRSHWEYFIRLYDDELFREFLPLPKDPDGQALYVEDTLGQLHLHLTVMSKMSSPVTQLVMPLRRMSQEKIIEALSITNLAPLVLTEVDTSDQRYINLLARESASLPRKLILVGNDGIVVRHPLRRIKTSMAFVDINKLVTMPLESIGSMALRRYARSEQINTPIIRKE